MAWKKDRTRKTMTWLDCYGLYREAGVNQFKTQESLDGNSEFVLTAQADMEAGVDAARAESVAATKYAGDVLMAIGGVVLAAASETVAGAIIGALLLAVGAILSFFADMFHVECDKYHCGGYDRNTTTRRKTYRAHVRSLVGVYVPNSSEYNSAIDCYCNHKRHHCRLVQYLHDGLVMRGQDWDRVDSAPSESGEVRGANALVTSGGSKGCHEYWRKDDRTKPVNKDGGDLEVGNKEKPWEGSENSYYYRAWKVRSILEWITGETDGYKKGERGENILCRTMECMEEVLEETSKSGGDSKFNQKRRRGSRWYSSIVWMQRDIWEMGQFLVSSGRTPIEGWEKFGNILKNGGCGKRTLDTIREMATGKEYSPEELPFPWTPLFKYITFWQMRDILIALKPHFPWIREKKPQGGEPVGEEARERSSVLAPMFVPMREPMIFRLGMKPIPAKLGSRGPGMGTIALGTGAALLGAYAIYKLMAPSEE